MKKTKFIMLMGCICSGLSLFADPPRRDTVIAGSYTPAQAEIMEAPVLMGLSEPIHIVPNSNQFCFDKHMLVKSTVSSGMVEQCLLFNTTDGLLAHLKPNRMGGVSNCDIKDNEKDFSLFLYGLKGNTYHYFNRENKGNIEHRVMTANSQTYLYEPPVPGGTAILHLKTETRMYCGNKFKGKAYKFDGSAQTWFLFGPSFPETLEWQGFFGNFGVGYLKTDKGLYLSLEMEYDGNSFKVSSFEDINDCFNPQPFEIMEDIMYQKKREALDKQREKLAIEQAKLSSGDCVSERTELYEFKMETLRQQEQHLDNSMVGNTWQNTNTQKAMLDMMDPKVQLETSILETKVSICKKQEYLSKNPSSTTTQEKLNCLQSFIGTQRNYLSQMEALDAEHANNPGLAYAEKAKLMFQLMSQGCN